MEQAKHFASCLYEKSVGYSSNYGRFKLNFLGILPNIKYNFPGQNLCHTFLPYKLKEDVTKSEEVLEKAFLEINNVQEKMKGN